MPEPRPKAPLLTPREYYASVLEMLQKDARIDKTDQVEAMKRYDAGDPSMIDAMFGLAGPGDVRHAVEGYQKYRNMVGAPLEKIPERGMSRDPAEQYYNVRKMATPLWHDAHKKLVSALEAERQRQEAFDAEYSQPREPDEEGIVPPPDKPGYAKPKPKVTVTIGQAVPDAEVGKAEIITPEEMKKRLKEAADAARASQEQAHKFMLGRPRYG